MRFKKIKQKSDKKKLRDKIGALHFKILKLKRGDICEVHQRKCGNIGRAHILPVSLYPRLEFYDPNIILAGWYCSHFYSHHNPDDPRAKKMNEMIIELRGEDYRERLLAVNSFADKHTMFYLQMLHESFKQRLEDLKDSGLR